MDVFDTYLSAIKDTSQRARTKQVLDWVADCFDTLQPRLAWNQPMFTDHGTFIIGFSVSERHLAIAPERAGILHFSDAIVQAGFEHSQQLIRMPWNRPVDFTLLEEVIQFNISEKANCTTFWRK